MSVNLNATGDARGVGGGRSESAPAHSGGGRSLVETIRELAPELHFAPVTRVLGAVDELSPDVVDDLRAVLREALTNVARHARARTAEVELAVTDEQATLRVTDDGVGCAGAPKDGGLADARRRARWHGGGLTVEPGPAGGTRLTWTVPLR